MTTSTLDIKFHIHSTLFRHSPLINYNLGSISYIYVQMYPIIHSTLFAPDCAICFVFVVSFPIPILRQILGPIVYTYSCLFLCGRSTDVSFSRPFKFPSALYSYRAISYHESVLFLEHSPYYYLL